MLTDNEILEPMIRGKAPVDRFIITGMYLLLKEFDLLDTVREHSPQDPNWTRIVSGHPMLHWNGKKYYDILRELGGDEKKAHAVLHAMEDMGVKLSPEQHPRTATPPREEAPAPMTEEQAAADEERRFREQQAQRRHELDEAGQMEGEGGRPVVGGEAAAEEPTFNGKPLSFFANLTDAQMLEIEGISKATVKAIRTAQKAAAGA